MRSASRFPVAHAAGLGSEDLQELANATLADSSPKRGPLARFLLAPFHGRDIVRRSNTVAGVSLFAGAAFAELTPAELPSESDDALMGALFAFGAIEAAVKVAGLPGSALRSIELAFLRRTYGYGRLRARRLHRELERRARTRSGRHAVSEGHVALIEWFDGVDPVARMRELVRRTPAERPLQSGRHTKLPVRARPPRPTRAASVHGSADHP